MSIWDYSDDPTQVPEQILRLESCLFCTGKLLIAHRTDLEPRPNVLEHDWTEVRQCSACGWWSARRDQKEWDGLVSSIDHRWGTFGVLRNLDLSDQTTPIREVRDFLTARYSARHDLHPRIFEQTEASVFADHGFDVQVTAYSNDGGVDVVLRSENELIGVQVKRYHNAIEAEQIRSLLGALVVGGYTRGVFVTTSKYRSGADAVASAATCRGYPIELLDAQQFYEALRVAQGTLERTPGEWLEIVGPRLKLISSGRYNESYYSHG
jgi:restriction system protein